MNMTRMSYLRWAASLLFALGCVGIAVHAFHYLAQEFNPANPFHRSFARSGWIVPLHFYAAGLALLLTPWVLSEYLRSRWPRLHRMGGWLYVLAVAIGGVAGLLLSPRAQGGWSTGASFLLLGLLWLLSTGFALFHVLRRNYVEHRRWMLRSVALTFGAVTLRIYLGLAIAVLGLEFAAAYMLAAWLCWPINLLLVEYYLRRVPRPGSPLWLDRGTHSASHPAGA